MVLRGFRMQKGLILPGVDLGKRKKVTLVRWEMQA